MVRRYPHNIESHFFGHPGVTANSITEGESLIVVRPTHRNESVRSFLIVVVVSLIFVDIELAIRAGINTKFNWSRRHLVCVLNLRTQGQNRSGWNEERNAIQGSGSLDVLFTFHGLSGPEVIPDGGSRQVHRTMDCVLFHYGVHQERGSEHELVADIPRPWILLPVHDQGSLNGIVSAMYAPGKRVDIRHQAIPELVVLE